ncbi:hypothetical protein IWQ62_001296 [Dispira parvispora]|uniref:Uncharacterized protein n=1 Tax=Dispira parvispora TaxID=1520584 RepID=A0A9W8E8C3_9FUNG|nr:hypothetical protein IWQ62_001296 [Dispira parvispora]
MFSASRAFLRLRSRPVFIPGRNVGLPMIILTVLAGASFQAVNKFLQKKDSPGSRTRTD